MDRAIDDKTKSPIRITSHKTGFDIGWDWAYYRVGLPDAAEDFPDFMQGYQASIQRGNRKESDRFIRKWLQLRFNAWRRNRAFSPLVSPEFIRQIDVDKCPITLQKLTHGAMQDSDWSVDRIQNDAGYVPGNLVVVSTKANSIKANFDHRQISQFAFSSDVIGVKAETGLTPIEWRRWFLICSLAQKDPEAKDDEGRFTFIVAPCVIIPPPMTFVNPSCALQLMINVRVSPHATNADFVRLTKVLSPREKEQLGQIIKHASRVLKKREHIFDIWHSAKLFLEFYEFFMEFNSREAGLKDIVRVLHELGFYREPNPTIKWHTDTGGYVVSTD